MELIIKLQENYDAVVLLRMIFAAICGGLIGLERELKGRPAGLKTFSLVCLGATLSMITNEYISNSFNSTGDMARMAAQVISGIGFLGAGTIIVTGSNQIRGLTTAAALWVTATLGISIGAGLYFGAFCAILIIFLSSVLFVAIEKNIGSKSRIMRVYAEGMNEDFIFRLIDYISHKNIRVISILRHSEYKLYKEDTCALIEMDLKKRQKHDVILEEIRLLEGFRYVEEM